MKKLGLLVISGVLVGIMLTGCCSHTFKAATCEEPEICQECGETKGSPRGHDWSEATCEEPETCRECGITYGEPLGHDFSEATCLEPEVCSVCGEEGEPAFGHDFSEETCERPEICNICGDLGDSKNGHSWKEATYYAPETCSVCGETRGEKLTSPSEWGFNDFAEMGNKVVSIDGYSLVERGKEYVIVTGSAFGLENGYFFRYDLVKNGEKVVLQQSKYTPSPYTIVNNENLLYEYNYYSYAIQDRKTVSIRDDFVVLVMNSKKWGDGIEVWVVPYNLIDWSRGMDTITNEDGTTSNIMYLVPER